MVLENLEVYKHLLPKLLRMPNDHVTPACKKIIKASMDLMLSNEIKSDIMLLRTYHKIWLNKYMCYLQGGDTFFNKSPGFQSRLMGTTYYLMHTTITSLMEGKWKTNSEFQSFIRFNIKNLNEDELIIQEKKVSLTL